MPSQQRLDPQVSIPSLHTQTNHIPTHSPTPIPAAGSNTSRTKSRCKSSAIIWDIRRTLLLDRRSKSEGLLWGTKTMNNEWGYQQLSHPICITHPLCHALPMKCLIPILTHSHTPSPRAFYLPHCPSSPNPFPSPPHLKANPFTMASTTKKPK